MSLYLSPKEKRTVEHFEIEQAILVPSTQKADKKISQAQYKKRIKNVRLFLAKKFGGYTSVKAVGGYYSDSKKKLIKEKITKVTSFVKASDFKKKEPILMNQLKTWGKKWGQESIGYEYEGDLYYISSKKPTKKKILKAKIRRKIKK